MEKKHCSKEDYCQFLLAAQKNFTVTEMADHLAGLSHDKITRWLASTKLPPSLLWEQIAEQIEEDGYLVLDDSVLAKPRSPNGSLVSWQYSGTSHQVTRGIGLVTLLWTKHDEHLPLDYRIYAKKHDGYTKNQHVQEMLRLASHRKVRPKAVVFDSWYASQANLNLIQDLGWIWITQLRGNRVVNFTSHIEELTIPKEGLVVQLKLVGLVKVFKFLAKNGDIEYWATNDLNLEPTDISKARASRWKIEEYHQGLKQTAGLEKCQARNQRSQRTHIFCSLLAFVSLEQVRLNTGQTWYQTKRAIIHDAITKYLKKPTIKLAFA